MTAHPGMERLEALRAFAQREEEALRPALQTHFDGVERVEADPDAVAVHECMRTVLMLIDGITADSEMLTRAVRILAPKSLAPKSFAR